MIVEGNIDQAFRNMLKLAGVDKFTLKALQDIDPQSKFNMILALADGQHQKYLSERNER